jgi:GLPGLI family protein
MKTLFKYFFFLPFSFTAYSQINEELAIAKCEYKFTHRYDTANFEKKISENYVLLLGKSASVYLSKDKLDQDSIMTENSKKTGVMTPPSGRRYNAEKIYLFQNKKNLFITSHIVIGKYIVEKNFPLLDWELSKDTIHFNGYILNKATTQYRGRNYICWYAPSLPFKGGPWKLNGLPGLIFKAYDETNRISFELTSFTQAITQEKIKWDDKYKNITWDEYLKLVYFERDDPDGFIQTRFPGIQITSSVTPEQRKKLSRGTIIELPKYINFPLEDKKYLYLR